MASNTSHYINGMWTQGSGALFFSTNPANGHQVWQGKAAAKEEVDQAVRAAKEASENWANTPFDRRRHHLESFKNTLSENIEQIATVISEETGKPLWESKNEVKAIVGKVDLSIEAFHIRCPEVIKTHLHATSVTRHHPHGVMAVLGPFNFPGHLPHGHIIPALLAGNTVVFKPSELTPKVAELLVKSWEISGLPKGVMNLIQGGGSTGSDLAKHPEIDGLLFTGSWKTGQRLSEMMAPTPYKILALEMGGNNPLIIGNITDFKTAAYLTILSAFLTSGQRCTCARRLIVPIGKMGDEFLKTLQAMTHTIRVGSYDEVPEPFMGPVISDIVAKHLLEKYRALGSSGGVPLVPMQQLDKGKAFVSPAIIDVTAISLREDEEIFGPLLQVIRTATFEDSLKEASKTNYGLVAGLFSDHEAEYQAFYKKIKAGVVNWNTPSTGASSAAPFGGIGQSGNHRPSAFYAADYCAYPVASQEAKQIQPPLTINPGIVW